MHYYGKISLIQMRRKRIMSDRPIKLVSTNEQRGSGARRPGGTNPLNEGARAPKHPRGPRPPKR
jgi:hypothetical protein